MSEVEKVIYYGPRDDTFRSFIRSILEKGKMKDAYIDLLTDDESMKIYDQVFTHPTVDPEINYEFYEILGDQTVNKAIVWYLSRRFPELHCPTGVKIISRLKINLVSKKTFADIGMNLGMWEFVTADEETRQTKLKKTLEDVFEAFFGATESLLDNRIRNGVGYAISYNIISNLFKDLPISLKYEDLYDAKTRLKETFDWHRDKLRDGILNREKYVAEKIEKINYVSVFNEDVNGRRTEIGKGSAALKEDAEQRAAENAIEFLKRKGLMKPIPEEYARFEKRMADKSKSG
jgi:dsRNA-specific ribonuclease